MDESLDTMAGLEKLGFNRFYSVKELHATWGTHKPPSCKGIYLVIWKGKGRPEFRDQGTWKDFGRLHVSKDVLKAKWVEDALVIYVGANRVDGDANLQKRIKQLIDFGHGKGSAHRGGCHMWQIKDAENLEICWKPVTDEKQQEVRTHVLEEFKRMHNGKLPFANQRN